MAVKQRCRVISVVCFVGLVSSDKPEELQRYFPDFVWLLRNVINLPEDEYIPLKTYIQSEDVCSTQQSRRQWVSKSVVCSGSAEGGGRYWQSMLGKTACSVSMTPYCCVQWLIILLGM